MPSAVPIKQSAHRCQAQAAYAFVSAMFTSLYDHMPVYTAEPSAEERAAAARLLETASRGAAHATGTEAGIETGIEAGIDAVGGLPAPRGPHPSERVPA